MHKITPGYTALGVHTAGGMVTVVNEANDDEGMQTTGGNSPGGSSGMSGEMAGKDPAPQNYGFTSRVAKGKDIGTGKGTGAEAFVSFMGGNRSFPIIGSMDDRRNRLKGLEEGASGMFGLKEWGQQLLNSAKGWHLSGNMEKKIRFALTENKRNQQQQQQQGGQSGGGGGAAVAALETGGSSGGGNGQQQGQQKPDLGQKCLRDEENEKSDIFYDQDKNRTHQGHKDGQAWYDEKMSLGYHKSKDKSYRSDADHSHIQSKSENTIFVTDGGCFSTKEIVIAGDPCSSGASAVAFAEIVPTGYHLAHVQPPLVQNTHTASLAYHEPLWLVNNSLTLKHDDPLAVDGTGTLQVKRLTPLGVDGSGNFILKFVAPLVLDGSGNLTVTPDPALGGLAPIESPNFTGDPRAPTPAPSDNDTSIATTAFVQTATIPLAPKDSPALTGLPTAPTMGVGLGHDNDNTIATTAFARSVSGALADAAVAPLLARIEALQAQLTALESRLA